MKRQKRALLSTLLSPMMIVLYFLIFVDGEVAVYIIFVGRIVVLLLIFWIFAFAKSIRNSHSYLMLKNRIFLTYTTTKKLIFMTYGRFIPDHFLIFLITAKDIVLKMEGKYY